MRLRAATSLVLLLAGCPSTGRHGLTPVYQNTSGPAGTVQECLPEPGVVEAADAALVAILRAAVVQGVVRDYSEAAGRVGLPGICVLPGPEMCGTILAAGCTGRWGIWLIKTSWRVGLGHELAHWLAEKLGPPYPQDHSGSWAKVEASLR